MNETTAPFPPRGGRAGDGGASTTTSAVSAPVSPTLDPSPSRREGSSGPAPGGVARARRFRREATLAERLLWAELRRLNLNFRRQVPIGPYVADFVHHASNLVVEIDGYYHEAPERRRSDTARTAWLNAVGYRVIRFSETVVRNDLYTIVDRIASELSPPSPALPPPGGKGDLA